MIPIIRILGLNNFSIRLPSAFGGIITVLVFYLFARKDLRDKDGSFSMVCMLFMAIVPWNVMISRWALESNLLPVFLLLGGFFFIKGINKSFYFVISMLFYGMSLYTYSVAWVVMPFFIGGEFLYILFFNKHRIDKWLVLSIVVLCFFSVPLVLFVLVNCDGINEISFLGITVPKLPYFRSREVNIENLISNFARLKDIVIFQRDGLVHNSINCGIYYKISIIFFIVGIIGFFYNFKSYKRNVPCLLMGGQFICGIVLGILIEGNINRVNIIHIPIIYIICTGIYEVLSFAKKTRYYFSICGAIIIAYAFSFWLFFSSYINDYNKDFALTYGEGLREAVIFSCSQCVDGDINIMDANYANVLLYSQYPTDEYVDTVIWEDKTAAFRTIIEFGNYKFNEFTCNEVEFNDIYVCNKDNRKAMQYMISNHLTLSVFGNYVVGYME